MSSFTDIIAAMMKDPPDPNGPIPLSNEPATMYGATLPFHVLSWVAVAFRLYTRFKVVRDPGWDDYIMVISALFNLAGHVCFFGAIRYGLGKHLLYIPANDITMALKFLYIQNASYFTTTGSIKMSLLCQYLRLFKTGMLRKACIVLLVIASIFTAAWSFQGWFPCFPVSGFWDRLRTPPPSCWGTGFSSVHGAMFAFVAFAASNMCLDTIIFAIPMVVYFRADISKRQVLSLTGLFALGSVVVLMAVLRLWTAIRQKANVSTGMDFTWWYPLTLMFSFLEMDFAIICASIPIFWPVIVASLPEIFVTQEVRVTHHQRIPESGGMDFEMERPHSLKSHTSQEGLTKDTVLCKTDYGDRFVVEHVLGKVPESTAIEAGRRNKKNGWAKK